MDKFFKPYELQKVGKVSIYEAKYEKQHEKEHEKIQKEKKQTSLLKQVGISSTNIVEKKRTRKPKIFFDL